ncbi:MAG TPA: methyl-accepting chemotaxis protein [Spirochaetota bacterium]|nr:methyl-accepting chemotaxis protein [Spirochaetota bacterium]HPV40517.1 methyl-accepting chemotaxis protein [Spirochaetota bacterium]
MNFSDLGIKKKLMLGFGLVFVLMMMIGGWSFFQMNIISDSIHYNQVRQELRDMIKEKEINHLDWVSQVYKGLLANSNDAINVETDGHKCKFGKWYYSEDRRRAEREMPQLKTELAKIEEPHLNLHREVINVKEALRFGGEGGRRTANAIFNEKIINHLKEVRSHLNKINDDIKNEFALSEKNIADSIRTGILLVLGLLAVSLAVGVAITVLISRSITRPVELCLGFADSIAQGDLTRRIELKQKDEIGRMVTALNSAAKNLEEMFYNVSVGSQGLARAVDQIASGNQTLSQRTTEQASALEEIVSTIEEAISSINQTAENAVKAKELTEAGADKSIEGNRVALEAVSSIIEMNESSKRIADIISVINEIAFQTNLLALNAAVEAARAGEQGRGFAVVAGEVRNLAQRSGNAAREIEDLIRDTVAKVEKSTDLVKNTGGSLGEIAEAAKTTARIISEIAASAIEQKQGVGQISTAISEMDGVTQQNAALVEETASASEEMANQAQEFLAMVQKFKISKSVDIGAGRTRLGSLSAAETVPVKKNNKGNGDGRKKPTGSAADSMNGSDDTLKKILRQEGFEEF